MTRDYFQNFCRLPAEYRLFSQIFRVSTFKRIARLIIICSSHLKKFLASDTKAGTSATTDFRQQTLEILEILNLGFQRRITDGIVIQ